MLDENYIKVLLWKTALGITESKDYTTLCFLQGYKSALEFVLQDSLFKKINKGGVL